MCLVVWFQACLQLVVQMWLWIYHTWVERERVETIIISRKLYSISEFLLPPSQQHLIRVLVAHTSQWILQAVIYSVANKTGISFYRFGAVIGYTAVDFTSVPVAKIIVLLSGDSSTAECCCCCWFCPLPLFLYALRAHTYVHKWMKFRKISISSCLRVSRVVFFRS